MTRSITDPMTSLLPPELEKLLDKVERDIKLKRNISPRFKTVEEAIDYLDNL